MPAANTWRVVVCDTAAEASQMLGNVLHGVQLPLSAYPLSYLVAPYCEEIYAVMPCSLRSVSSPVKLVQRMHH